MQRNRSISDPLAQAQWRNELTGRRRGQEEELVRYLMEKVEEKKRQEE